MNSKETIKNIQNKAQLIRRYSLEMTTKAGSGHPGGSLSSADIISSIYFYKLKHNPDNPEWEERDRFILSKGHACPALYAALSIAGYFDEQELMTLRKLGSRLQGHPEKGTLPGIEASTGPLGQGISFGNGVAMSMKLDNINSRVYALVGDGEIQEGQIWEAAMTSSHYKLDNITVIVDNNNLQIDGEVSKVKKVSPINKKFESFGWHVIEIDGHNIDQITKALDKADTIKNKPTAIVANTIKGKGVACMENKAEWHGKACTPTELEDALKELGESN